MTRDESAETSPAIAGFHPDPTICRVGEDYYVAMSSFEYSPSVPIWHSRDLQTWTLLANALDRDSQFQSARSRAGGGIWAPTLRHHAGRFWLITTDSDSQRGQRLFMADAPEGPWSEAVEIPELVGIDPDIAWTQDGRCLVTYCAWNDEGAGIRQAEIDPHTGRALTEPQWIWRGTGLSHTEAPHLVQRNDWWYLFVAEGGTERGHVVSVARSRAPHGPFVPAPEEPLYTHRSTDHPVQNVGHLDVVQSSDGSWVGVHLGVRARGITPGFHTNGREVFLVDVAWIDDWPVIRPSSISFKSERWDFQESFTSESLHPRWISPAARPETFCQPGSDGLQVWASDTSGLYVRVQPLHWEAAFEMSASDAVAVVEVRVDDRHRFGARISGGGVQALLTIGGVEVDIGPQVPHDGWVAIGSVPSATGGPDDLVVLAGSGRSTLAVVDGRYLSTEVVGGFSGRVVGIRTESGIAMLRSFRLHELDSSAARL
ncbi:glycoside hydrolase family 43 protein [Microbacterium sp. NPDC087589]|uniref:glycoside hydrolase family 43 protein n=1 Tax=Microbacterium sp. NPDC087589 TaxID=3364191 RepID=UPI00382DBC6A